MCHRVPSLLLPLLLLLAFPLASQTLELRFDFGTSTYLPPTTPEYWNVVHPGNQNLSLALRSTAGLPTGMALAFDPGHTFAGGNANGTRSPVPGSPLALTGFPVEAYGDYIYGSSSLPLARFGLSGLAPGGSYDFVFTASRMTVTDLRQTRYTVVGTNTLTALLEPANNSQYIAAMSGALADANGMLTVEVEAGPANTNGAGFFYLNAMSLSGPAPSGNWLLFEPDRLECSQVAGRGPFTIETELQTNAGSPTAALTAVDLGTAAPPTWLAWSPSATTGTPIPLTVDASTLPIGSYAARLSAITAGYGTAMADVTLEVRADDGTLNVLFYGNSYSMGNGGVHHAVADLAEAAGHPRPTVIGQLVGGRNLHYHLTDPVQAAAITHGLPYGESWDFVVMQGYSLEATVLYGDPVAMAQNAGMIVQNVRAHSPAAKAVLFQTWARAPFHSYYSGTTPPYPGGPMQMHDEIRAGYENARQHIDALVGAGTAGRARAGEAFMLQGWDASLYNLDGSHQTPAGTLAAALALTTAIYGDLACTIDPAIGGNSALAQRLAGWGLGQAAWDDLAVVADRAAHPGLRAWPGSDDDLLLRSTTPASAPACAVKTISFGDMVNLSLTSPAGTFDGALVLLAAQLDPVGAPGFGGAGFPELHLHPVLAVPLGLEPLSPGGLALTPSVPIALPGWGVLVQGFAVATSPRTSNAFAATDAHELRW